MVKFLKVLSLVVVAFAILYAISFLFSNVGLGPSYDPANSDDHMVRFGSSSSYSLTKQDIPEVKSNSYLVVDLTSDKVIFSRRADSQLLVASLTKLMTAWIVINHGRLEDQYTITSQDTKSFSPVLELSVGDKVLVSDLLNAMLIGSANDAAMSLAHYIESVQPKPFIDLMNEESKNLRMLDTRFSNPNGFDSDTNYSSSNDLKILATKLYAKGSLSATSRATSYRFLGSKQIPYQIGSTNTLINNYSDIYAIKTGFTEEAQGSMINIIKHNNIDYLVIVIGSPDREGDTLVLRKKILELN